MKLSELKEKLDLEVVFFPQNSEVYYGYCGDLLSIVMRSLNKDSVWLTVQSHMNIIAVASLAGAKAIVLCEGLNFPDETVEKAKEEGIALFKSQQTSFVLAGKMYELGLR